MIAVHKTLSQTPQENMHWILTFTYQLKGNVKEPWATEASSTGYVDLIVREGKSQ